MKYILVLTWAIVVACGSESSSTSEAQKEKKATESVEALQSIMLATKADLPSCSDDNETQLAYISDTATFYVCEDSDWVEAKIVAKGEKGDQGEAGSDGVTTVKEVEATNKKNQWVDPISGLTWLLGGPSNWLSANSSCSGDYRLPTYDEAEDAINRGIRGIAASVPTGVDFWVNELGYIAGINASSLPEKKGVPSSNSYTAFCVK